jgi:acyl-CoA thioesterase-1
MCARLGRRAFGIAVCALLLWPAGCRSPQETSAPAPASAPAASAPAAAADPGIQSGRPKIVLLGDSLTAGLGLLQEQAYPALLQKKIDSDGYDYEVENAGVSGDTSAGGLRRLDWALEGDVRILVLALGANDGLRGLSTAEMKRNLTQIIERARERNILVILAGMEAPPNYGAEYAASFRQAYREIAQRERVTFIPFLLDRVAGVPELNQSDGIHPNVNGARVIAETVWSVLRPALDQIAAS